MDRNISIKRSFSSVVSSGRRRIRTDEAGEGVLARGVPTGLAVASRSKGFMEFMPFTDSGYGGCDDGIADLNECDCDRKAGAAIAAVVEVAVVRGNGPARCGKPEVDKGGNAGLPDGLDTTLEAL